jgi:hypothetical protein
VLNVALAEISLEGARLVSLVRQRECVVETRGLELRAEHAVLAEPVSGFAGSAATKELPSHMATRQERMDGFVSPNQTLGDEREDAATAFVNSELVRVTAPIAGRLSRDLPRRGEIIDRPMTVNLVEALSSDRRRVACRRAISLLAVLLDRPAPDGDWYEVGWV